MIRYLLPALLLSALPAYAQDAPVPARVGAAKMTLPTWSAQVNGDAMSTLIDASKKYGVLKGDVDADTFVNLG